jgi:phosphotransferase system enzyme I (PtsI)
MIDSPTSETIITGIAASPGICIGKAYLVDSEGVEVISHYHIPSERLSEEVNRFKSAVKSAGDEIRAVIESSAEELNGHTAILQAHEVLLKDKLLFGRTIDIIESEQINAEWALHKVVGNLKQMFQEMADGYLKERGGDVVQVADRILRNLVGANSVNIANIDKRVILVAKDLSPAETSQINLERIKGFVTETGGRASHTGIVARTLQIPAVLGLQNATRLIDNDDVIIVDGLQGLVVLNPSEQTIIEYEERHFRYDQFKAEITRDSFCQATTSDGVDVSVMGNIELPEEVVAVGDNGGDGIGLYRTEFQYLGRLDFPTEADLFDKYQDVVEVMAGKPVTIRTLDINGDKAVSSESKPFELNPALGLRGIRYCLQRPEIFITQLKAILRAAAYGNVRMLVPMVSSPLEIDAVRHHIDEAATILDKEGHLYNADIKLGIMIEVPAAVVMADVLAEMVDFFSIGTNDLIQYTLAIDRGNSEVAHLYHPLHPAILRMIRRTTEVARKKGIDIYMCGEMAGELEYLPILIGLGINELSMNPQSIPAAKCFIRELSLEQTQAFTHEVFKLDTRDKVIKLIFDTYGKQLAKMMMTE